MTGPSSAREVDVHALPAMLTALRLPSFHRHWPDMARRADAEGWPAARLLAALAEIELAERETRRIRRHLAGSRLPGGKTLATFDFQAVPAVPRKQVEALAAGDWIETGAYIIAIRCPTGHCEAISREGGPPAPARRIRSAPSAMP